MIKENKERRDEYVFLKIIKYATFLILFTPLVVGTSYFNPFIAPKTFYFMALAQVIFFTWLLLITYYPQYRPKANLVSITILFFLFILILSGLLGEDSSRSFWSKYERMTGILTWIHLVGFFLVISTVFKKRSDWFKFFSISIFIASLVALSSILIRVGVDLLGPLTEISREGSTIGNTSFMGTYLLFNVFLAFYMFLKTGGRLRIFFIASLPIMFSAMYLANARAATLSTIIGFGLLFFLYLVFVSKKSYLNILGKAGLAGMVVSFLTISFYLFKPGSFIHNLFVERRFYSRLIVWEGGWQGFLDKPILGWGPGNFEFIFAKYFDSCMFLNECGGETWFDRAHNIIVETLATSGILGLLAYGGTFLAVFYILWRRYFSGETNRKQKRMEFWTAGIFSAILVAYFIQNLTVFDTINSYLMFSLILGFVAYLESSSFKSGKRLDFSFCGKAIQVIILILFAFSFSYFIVQPIRSNRTLFRAVRTQSPYERTLLAEKALILSPLGKYQNRETLANRTINFSSSEETKNYSIREFAIELYFISGELEKSIEESPLDLRSKLQLGKIYNLYAHMDPQKAFLAEDVLEKALKISPTNQHVYWELVETHLRQENFNQALSWAEKAIELEPRVLKSHLIAIRVAKIIGDDSLIEEKIREAISVNSEWETHLRN